MTFDELDEVLTPAMIARYMRIGRAKVYSYLREHPNRGGLPHMMCGAHMRILKKDFAKWLENQVAMTARPKLVRAVK